MYRVGWSIMDIKNFSKYRPSCLIKTSSRPETYLLMCVGLLANHLFSTNLVFLAAASWQRWNEWHVLRKETSASRSHSAAIDGCRAARFELGLALTFACNTHKIEKSSKFKSGKYSSQSTKNWNSTNSRWVVLTEKAGAKSTERRIFHQDKSSGARGPNVVSKALARCQRRHLCWQNQLATA